MAGSGTCQHPQRRELRDVVLVRQTELACRNSYDQDLWKPGNDAVLVSAEGVSSGGVIPDPDELYDLPAGEHTLSDSHHSLSNAETADTFTDRVTDVHVPASRQNSLARPRTPFLSPSLEQPPFDHALPKKAAVHHARQRREEERRRESQRIQESLISEVGARMASADAVGADASVPFELFDAAREPAEPAIPIAGLHEFPELVPTLRRSSQAPTPFGRANEAHSQHAAQHNGNRSDILACIAPPSGTGTGFTDQGTEPLPTEDVRAMFDAGYSGGSVQHVQDERHEPVVHVDGAVRSFTSEQRERPLALQVAESQDPIDRMERLAALKRCCATCRDFRQVSDGERGWCNNPYAFGERRMVQSDQLTCRSSLGMWWMPNDDVWLERADTSHHGRPTPLLDATLKTQRSGEPGRDSHV